MESLEKSLWCKIGIRPKQQLIDQEGAALVISPPVSVFLCIRQSGSEWSQVHSLVFTVMYIWSHLCLVVSLSPFILFPPLVFILSHLLWPFSSSPTCSSCFPVCLWLVHFSFSLFSLFLQRLLPHPHPRPQSPILLSPSLCYPSHFSSPGPIPSSPLFLLAWKAWGCFHHSFGICSRLDCADGSDFRLSFTWICEKHRRSEVILCWPR